MPTSKKRQQGRTVRIYTTKCLDPYVFVDVYPTTLHALWKACLAYQALPKEDLRARRSTLWLSSPFSGVSLSVPFSSIQRILLDDEVLWTRST